MTPAEIRSIRESLGLSHEELAAALDIDVRSVRRWETGEQPIHTSNANGIRKILDITNTTIRRHVIDLRARPNPTLLTYWSNDNMWADFPALAPLTARWHRIIAARVSEHVPGLTIAYPPKPKENA